MSDAKSIFHFDVKPSFISNLPINAFFIYIQDVPIF